MWPEFVLKYTLLQGQNDSRAPCDLQSDANSFWLSSTQSENVIIDSKLS